jgi:putative hydrolase of the HAD superfamily
MEILRAICFDLDGTLVDFTGDFQALILQNANKLGVPQALHGQFAEAFSKYTRSLATSLEITRQTLSDLGLASPENLELLCQQATQRYTASIHLMNGAKELLESLCQQDIPLAIITNGPTDMQLASIYKVNIQDYFKAILISGELGIRKPDAQIFRLACERLDFQPGNCLMVGDNLSADVQGARRTGMQAVWMSQESSEGLRSFSGLAELRQWLYTQL